jgi:hypothetical protein
MEKLLRDILLENKHINLNSKIIGNIITNTRKDKIKIEIDDVSVYINKFTIYNTYDNNMSHRLLIINNFLLTIIDYIIGSDIYKIKVESFYCNEGYKNWITSIIKNNSIWSINYESCELEPCNDELSFSSFLPKMTKSAMRT